MTNSIQDRLAALGLQLPRTCQPRGAFLPYTRSEKLVWLSGQICEWDGIVGAQGCAGDEVSLEAAQIAARTCALNLLFHLRDACSGDLGRVVRCLRVGVFVNARNGFADSPKVGNGASDLFIALWGEAGRHARTAVGVSALPMNAAVEVDAIFEIRP